MHTYTYVWLDLDLPSQQYSIACMHACAGAAPRHARAARRATAQQTWQHNWRLAPAAYLCSAGALDVAAIARTAIILPDVSFSSSAFVR